MTPADVVRAYHQRTKHRLDRYAAGPQTLDWDAQPDPFRRFTDAPLVPLPLGADRIATLYADLYRDAAVAAADLTVGSLATLLELSLGLAAWKQYGSARWALRCNPSSGNLHPTEGYVVIPDIAGVDGTNGIAGGVYHYASREHALEARCVPQSPRLAEGPGPGRLLVVLSSIHWREAWKYGERAFRYCQLDEGHAIAAVRYAAAAHGWRVTVQEHWGDDQVTALLGLDRAQDFAGAEPEQPGAVLLVQTGTDDDGGHCSPAALLAAVTAAPWRGKANRLDPRPLYQWPVIGEVAAAAGKPATSAPGAENTVAGSTDGPLRTAVASTTVTDHPHEPAAGLIRRRRSTQAFDAGTEIDERTFYGLLDRLVPRAGVLPWDMLPWHPRLHPVLFVHRVAGIPPGLYALARRSTAVSTLRASLRAEFDWEPPAGCPQWLPLFRLVRADARRAAGTVSCHQAIAADAAFSVAMVAEFDSALAQGAWAYRRLFWEAGVLGQILYLDAEARGLRGTGIGCFFDDVVHDILGITDTRLQSLYHFAVGRPVVDRRLITLPPYHHLRREAGRPETDGHR